MFNRVILIGRLTRDPELKRTGTGLALTKFTLAVDRKFKSQGSDKKEADFFQVVTWDKLAEHCNEYLKKGLMVAVEGRLQSQTWETQQGEKRTTIDIRADDVRFLEKPGSRGGSSSGSNYSDPDEDDYSERRGGASGGSEKLFPDSGSAKKQQAGGRRDFGKPVSDSSLDEEIDLDEDEPF